MQTNRLIIFVIVALIVVAGAIWYTNNNELPEIELTPPVQEQPEQPMAEVTIEDLKVGTGAEAKVGDQITVHYVGTLEDGTVFDSSRERGESITFGLNPGGLIEGWIQGIPGMKIGGVRKLTVPPELGYGSNDYGPIPANSTLHFEVELLGVGSGE